MERIHVVEGGRLNPEAVIRLAQAIGLTGDPADEHWRWEVYRAACEVPTARDLLVEATQVEPDGSIAVGVVFEMLDRDSDDAALSWVNAVPPADRERVLLRAKELAFERAVRLRDSSISADELDGWSDWLQRRVAHLTESESVLRVLEQHGRTRRVRGEARERLGAMRRTDPAS